MTAPAPTPGVVARWTTRRRPATGAVCDECREVVVDSRCGCCGQLAGETVGMLAAVMDTPAGARLVIAEHGPGGWAPIQTVPATRTNLAALSRPGATGPAPVIGAIPGGLW
jgi:hypothetical protein